MTLQPARLAYRDGTPCSDTYGDIYHSSSGGLEQAHHVFLAGCDVQRRWQGRARFTIVETGFGIGLNFLATWAAWRADPARSARLHFVSTELHPFSVDDLTTLHQRWPALGAFAQELRAAWPALTPGFHRLHLDHGAVTLSLLFGNAATMLAQLECAADAFYLDGFAPDRNPDMWCEKLLHRLGALAAREATVATWSVCASVLRGLTAAGFDCHKTPGFAHKRVVLRGRHRGPGIAVTHTDRRQALVIGAGVAGTCTANRLAERGWTVHLIDAADAPGRGASGNHAAVVRPLPSLDDNRLARLTRAGSLYGVHHIKRLAAFGAAVRWGSCGVLHLARDPAQQAKQRAVVAAHDYPQDYLRFVERDEASAIADWPLDLGGWWFSRGAWVQPPSLCAANLEVWPERIQRHFGTQMSRLSYDDGEWVALDSHGGIIARAPVAVLANGVGIVALDQAAAMPVRSARGQVSHLPATPESAPRVVICRLGYVSPAIDGVRSVGATFSVDDDDEVLREDDHRENLARLDLILPGFTQQASSQLAGRVGFRPASPDRLPMVGAVPVAPTADSNPPATSSSLCDIPRHPGLYAMSGFGARGLVWAALLAEYLASALDGDPLPIERELIDAIDPARYLLRPVRKRPQSLD